MVWFLAFLVAPTAALWACGALLGLAPPKPPTWLRRRLRPLGVALARPASRFPARRRPAPTPFADEVEQVLRITADLRRLEAELLQLRETGCRFPGKHLRLSAVTRAYDDALLEGARSLGLPTPCAPSPLPATERLLLEASLGDAGVRW